MSDYETYFKRLNRNGYDYQTRIQSNREKNFELYLLRSVYRVDFMYNGNLVPGSLERNTEDETQTTAYLLLRTKDLIPTGTILTIPDFTKNEDVHWMVWTLLERQAKGYNKYKVLKMNYELTWRALDGTMHTQWVHFRGLNTEPIRDKVKSATATTGHTIYLESMNLHMFITQFNPKLERDCYFEIKKDTVTLAYWITELDVVSTEGVCYASVDQRHKIDFTEPPTQTTQDNPDDYFWLNGGVDNGST